MAKDALGAQARDELHIVDATAARPIQAALASAASFAVGAVLPLLVALATPSQTVSAAVVIASLSSLALLGVLSGKAGGANMVKAVLRVTVWGAIAFAVTAGIGRLFGAVV